MFAAVFLIQRLFVALVVSGGPHRFWNPYDIIPSPDLSGDWIISVPLPLYMVTLVSCAIISVIINLMNPNELKRGFFVSQFVCQAGVLPTVLIILLNPGESPCYCSLSVFYTDFEIIAALVFVFGQVGVGIGSSVQILQKLIAKKME